jgi:hypothetical protein
MSADTICAGLVSVKLYSPCTLKYVPVGRGRGPRHPVGRGAKGLEGTEGDWEYWRHYRARQVGLPLRECHFRPAQYAPIHRRTRHSFAWIGVYNNAEGRAMLQSHLDRVVAGSANNVRTFVNEHGSFVVKNSLFAGPGGFVRPRVDLADHRQRLPANHCYPIWGADNDVSTVPGADRGRNYWTRLGVTLVPQRETRTSGPLTWRPELGTRSISRTMCRVDPSESRFGREMLFGSTCSASPRPD